MDARKYLGIPFQDKGCGFEGCDCYGLVRLVYREELGIELPCLGDSYSTAYARGEVNNTVQHVSAADWNMDILGGPYKLFDVLVFRRGVDDAHVGLWIAPGWMLHIMEGVDSCRERYDGIRWGRMLHRAIRHMESQ